MSLWSSKSRVSVVTDENRGYMVEWLRDRSAFHGWFSSLVTGSFVVITVFGSKPDVATTDGVVLAISVVLFLFALLCNLVCVWSIPSWKYAVSTGIVKDVTGMLRELAITAWLGVVSFVSGLTLVVIANAV